MQAHMGNQEPLLGAAEATVPFWAAFKEELRAIIVLLGPACVQLGCQQACLVTNQVFAGSLGADALAAAAIGFTVNKHTPLSVLFHAMQLCSPRSRVACYSRTCFTILPAPRPETFLNLCSSSTCAGISFLAWDQHSTHVGSVPAFYCCTSVQLFSISSQGLASAIISLSSLLEW